MSTARVSDNADDFLGHLRAIDRKYKEVFGPWLAKTRAELEAKTGKKAPEIDEALEEHRRVYVVDRILRALNWRTGLESGTMLPALAVEQPLRSAETGKSVRLDYLGVEAETDLPLMVVETKAPRDCLPSLAKRKVDTLRQVFAMGLAGADVTNGWREWLDRQCDYIRSVKNRTGRIPRRHRSIHVFEDRDELEDRFDEVYELLEYSNVAAKLEVIRPEQIAFVVDPAKVERASYGLLLLHSKNENLRGPASPAIQVAPLVFLQATRGRWIRVEAPDDQQIFRLPGSRDELADHLTDVQSAATELWQVVCKRLGHEPKLVSVSEYYADAVDAQPGEGVQEWRVGGFSMPTCGCQTPTREKLRTPVGGVWCEASGSRLV